MPDRSRLGEFLRHVRRSRGMSQGDLAHQTGVRRDYIGSVEVGRINVIYPETFARLKSALGFPGWVGLEAMGFETDVAERSVLPELVTAVSRLGGVSQLALLNFVQSLLVQEEVPSAGSNE